jgi:hypothetical protein
MKRFGGSTWIFLIALTSVVISFWVTRSWAIARWQEANPVWLQNVPAEIIQNEEAFSQWIEKTRQTLTGQQLELVQLLQNPQSQDQAILTQTDRIAQTHAQLLRGIGQHLKSIRSVLPDNQKKLLTGFCLQTLRGPMLRAGYGHQEQRRLQQKRSGGPGFGNGFGRGRRQGHCGLTQKLQLTEEQIGIAAHKDPAFETDINLLQNQLLSQRQKLLSLLEDQQGQNGQVSQQIECIIDAHNALAKRLINYILIMRPHFTTEQQKCLFGLCTKTK